MKRSLKLLSLFIMLSVVILPLVSCQKEGNTPVEKVFLHASHYVRGNFFLSLEDYDEITEGYAVKYAAASNKTGSEGLNLVVDHALEHNMAVMGQGMRMASANSNVMYYSSIKVFDTLDYGAALDFANEQGQVDVFDLTTGYSIANE